MPIQYIADYLGRFHPVIVHLPIGFLFMALFCDLLSYHRKTGYLQQAVPLCLLLGFASGVLACILGFLLAGNDDYNNTILERHKVAGIVVTIFAGLLLFIRSSIQIRLKKVFSTMLVVMIAVLTYAGHQGGSLTHGEDFLHFSSVNVELPANVAEAVVFQDVVKPILKKKCGQCHNNGKKKGELTVQTLEALLKGGEKARAIVPGSTDSSELYRRIMLDPDHEDFMPSDGKPPLTQDETDILVWWIAETKAADNKKIKDLPENKKIQEKIARRFEIPIDSIAATEFTPKINPDIPLTADVQAIERLRKKGVMIRVMLHKPTLLDVTLPPGIFKMEIQSELKVISPNVVWLDLSDNQLVDTRVHFLADFRNLEKLRLDGNPVGDGVVPIIQELKHLQAINLVNTNISSTAVEQLRNLKTVKRIYVWNE